MEPGGEMVNGAVHQQSAVLRIGPGGIADVPIGSEVVAQPPELDPSAETDLSIGRQVLGNVAYRSIHVHQFRMKMEHHRRLVVSPVDAHAEFVFRGGSALVRRKGRMREKRLQPGGQSDLAIGHGQERTVAPVSVHEDQCAAAGSGHAATDVLDDRQHGSGRHPDGSGTPGVFVALGVREGRQQPHVQTFTGRPVHGALAHGLGDGEIGHQGKMRSMLFDRTNGLHENRPGREDLGHLGSREMSQETDTGHRVKATSPRETRHRHRIGHNGTMSDDVPQTETSRNGSSAPDRFDAIVIGAGHNGLVAANYLARAGMSVGLFEARSTVGGCSSSETMGDVTVNICNCDHITFRTTPILEELDLASHGLRYLEVEPSQLNLDWDGGPAWAVCHSVDMTLDVLARTYPDQVDGYRRYVADALPVARLVLAAAAAGPHRRQLLSTAWRGRGRGIRRLLQWSRLSAEQVMRSYFSDERVYAPALATGPVVWGLSPRLPGTGLGALTYALRHAARVGRPVGGSGSLAVALQSAFLARSGSLFTSASVASIILENGTAAGVRLSDGRVFRSPCVISAADPARTFLEWLQNPPSGAGRTIERWRNHQPTQGYESKIDAIIDTVPEYRQVDREMFEGVGLDPMVASAMIVPTVREMHEAFEMMPSGRVADRPVFFANVPTVLDPSMAPAGRHVFSLEALFTPYDHPGGWASSTEPRRWLDRYGTLLSNDAISRMGPWRAMTPERYETDFHMPKGHATSFAGGPVAALRGRPRELTRYRTPVQGLYLCGAATFPGAGIWGASGRHCAHEVLRSRKS